MTFTLVMIVCIAIVLGIAGAFWAAISKGYDYKHTIDPHPDDTPGTKDSSSSKEAEQ
ncbi:YtzI protein [Halobacillus sp. A5]|uniref:YtzI protein n=1 Tax=Halobacillus sp. A5 TaxID=2880263 RepID=UPI0020A663D6|nr:YtzI protein [Halobacillus sp. A5]MCP3028181.1 YtzI protein [Halobacillus sp. A5]